MDDSLKAMLKNFVDIVIEYPEQTIEESFRKSGLFLYFECTKQPACTCGKQGVKVICGVCGGELSSQ